MIFSTSTLLFATMVVNAASVFGAPIRMASTVPESVTRSEPDVPVARAAPAIVDVRDHRPRSRLELNSRRVARLVSERDAPLPEVIEAREPEPCPSVPDVIVQVREEQPERRFPRRVYHDFYKRTPATSIKETVTTTKTTIFDTPADAAANAASFSGSGANAGSVAAIAAANNDRAAAAAAAAAAATGGSSPVTLSSSSSFSSTTTVADPNGLSSVINAATATATASSGSASATSSASSTASSAESTASASSTASSSASAATSSATAAPGGDGEEAPESGAKVVSSTEVPANENDRRDFPEERAAPAACEGASCPPPPHSPSTQSHPATPRSVDPQDQNAESRRWVKAATSQPIARRIATSGPAWASALRRREANLDDSMDSHVLRNVNTENS